jgi:hypothetical protein
MSNTDRLSTPTFDILNKKVSYQSNTCLHITKIFTSSSLTDLQVDTFQGENGSSIKASKD